MDYWYDLHSPALCNLGILGASSGVSGVPRNPLRREKPSAPSLFSRGR